MTAQDERRHFWRSEFHAPAHVVLHGRDHAVQLLDVSLKGALVTHDGHCPAQAGEHCHLRINLGAGAVIAMDVHVAHVEGLHLGLQCEKIDIDSITHLRQLVERNASDPAMLDRDLAMLAARR